MTLWIVLIVFSLLAIVFAVWPLWREAHKLTPLVATVIVLTVAVSVGLYGKIGSPGVASGRAANSADELPGMDEAIAQLEARLEKNPDDINGWKMLGRSYMSMRNYAGAVQSYERAMEIENGQDPQTLVDLAIALSNRDQTPIEVGRPADLLNNALKLDANNQAALFYGGIAAANSGDTDTAADHWERLLGLNPPDNVRGILEQNVAIWRGETPPPTPSPTLEPAASETPQEPAASVADDAVVSANVSLSTEAMSAITVNAPVFIIARDPAVPVPPIAVSRLMLSELPGVVSLSDAQSMVEGRNLSGFAEIELLARVSLSGGPAAKSGDWFGSLIVRPAENNSVTLTIDQQVP